MVEGRHSFILILSVRIWLTSDKVHLTSAISRWCVLAKVWRFSWRCSCVSIGGAKQYILQEPDCTVLVASPLPRHSGWWEQDRRGICTSSSYATVQVQESSIYKQWCLSLSHSNDYINIIRCLLGQYISIYISKYINISDAIRCLPGQHDPTQVHGFAVGC